MNPLTAIAEAIASKNPFTDLPEPPGGRPWALLGLCGGSLFLNAVLVARLALGGSGGAVADVAIDAPPAEPSVEASLQTPEPAAAPVAIPSDIHVVKADITDSLSRTFQIADPEHADVVSAVYARLFAFDLHLRTDLKRGDSLKVAYTWDGALTRIAAASYVSGALGKTLNAYEFQATGDKYPSYWDENGQERELRLVDSPIADYEQITSLLKDRPKHHGMDFKTPEGTPITSPRSGRVEQVNWNWTNNGNCVEVVYPDSTTAKFLHMSRVDVKAGDTVQKGTALGLSGNTGHSTAPHLHYELEKNGTIVDPVDYHGTIRRSLPASDMAAFNTEKARLEAMLQ